MTEQGRQSKERPRRPHTHVFMAAFSSFRGLKCHPPLKFGAGKFREFGPDSTLLEEEGLCSNSFDVHQAWDCKRRAETKEQERKREKKRERFEVVNFNLALRTFTFKGHELETWASPPLQGWLKKSSTVWVDHIGQRCRTWAKSIMRLFHFNVMKIPNFQSRVATHQLALIDGLLAVFTSTLKSHLANWARHKKGERVLVSLLKAVLARPTSLYKGWQGPEGPGLPSSALTNQAGCRSDKVRPLERKGRPWWPLTTLGMTTAPCEWSSSAFRGRGREWTILGAAKELRNDWVCLPIKTTRPAALGVPLEPEGMLSASHLDEVLTIIVSDPDLKGGHPMLWPISKVGLVMPCSLLISEWCH